MHDRSKQRGPKPKDRRESMGPNLVRELQQLRAERDGWQAKADAAIAETKKEAAKARELQAEALKRVGQVSADYQEFLSWVRASHVDVWFEWLELKGTASATAIGHNGVTATPTAPGK